MENPASLCTNRRRQRCLRLYSRSTIKFRRPRMIRPSPAWKKKVIAQTKATRLHTMCKSNRRPAFMMPNRLYRTAHPVDANLVVAPTTHSKRQPRPNVSTTNPKKSGVILERPNSNKPSPIFSLSSELGRFMAPKYFHVTRKMYEKNQTRTRGKERTKVARSWARKS